VVSSVLYLLKPKFGVESNISARRLDSTRDSTRQEIENGEKWLKIINSQEAIGNEEKVATKMHETKENEAFFVLKLLWCRTHPAWYTGKHDPGRK